MGSHYYYKQGEQWKLSKTISTLPQARKSDLTLCASVTTKLGVWGGDFLNLWLKKQCAIMSREYPNQSIEWCVDAAWGLRIHPKTQELTPASEWGTLLHEELEAESEAFKSQEYHAMEGDFAEWTTLWVDWLMENNVIVKHAELMVGCEDRQIAGALDFIGQKDGKIFLADYKSRDGKGDLKTLKGKSYDKDCQQLAIEAKMIQEQWGLDYIPRIYTVLFDTNKPIMHVKLWTESMQAKQLIEAERASKAWNERYPM